MIDDKIGLYSEATLAEVGNSENTMTVIQMKNESPYRFQIGSIVTITDVDGREVEFYFKKQDIITINGEDN